MAEDFSFGQDVRMKNHSTAKRAGRRSALIGARSAKNQLERFGGIVGRDSLARLFIHRSDPSGSTLAQGKSGANVSM